MSILRKIQEAIEASRSASDVAVNENPGHLTISGTFSRSALDAWQAVSDGIESWFSLECADESQDIIPPGCGVELERHRITIKFSAISGVAHIFTREGWRIFLHNSEFIAATHEVRLGFTKCTFSTRWFTIEPWTSQPSAKTAPERSQNKSNSPRRQVRSHSSNFMAPPLIEPWILLGPEPNEDPAVSIWKEISIQMTAKTLPNELYMDGESQKIAIAGQPTRKLNLGKTPPSGSLFADLQEATSWIYLEGEDIEVRHTFLSSELAREWPADTDFFDALPSKLNIALDSARLLYKAHLRSGSKDTLKSLSELRKTLSEEVQKLLQQSRELAGSVWRDVAIAIGVLAIRLSLDGVKAKDLTLGFALIYAIVAIYIGSSYAISISTNQNFLRIIEESRRSWRTKLYGFLDDEDYKLLAENPLRDAISAYKSTQATTTAVVIAVTVVLMIAAGIEIRG